MIVWKRCSRDVQSMICWVIPVFLYVRNSSIEQLPCFTWEPWLLRVQAGLDGKNPNLNLHFRPSLRAPLGVVSLVSRFIHTLVGVGAKVVALTLQQVGGQYVGAVNWLPRSAWAPLLPRCYQSVATIQS